MMFLNDARERRGGKTESSLCFQQNFQDDEEGEKEEQEEEERGERERTQRRIGRNSKKEGNGVNELLLLFFRYLS